jgi:apolipoprotein N-acyltransferase
VWGGSGWIYHNSAYLFDRHGQTIGRHDKSLLVPLAEEAVGALPSVERAFRRGDDTRPLRAGERLLGLLVCFEAIYPQVARQLVRQGATVLVNVTNDQLIAAGATQQAAMAVFRAVENRVPLVRVSNLGPSLTVDPFGRVAMLPTSEPGSVVSTLKLASGSTLYNQVGDVFALACLAISFARGVDRARTFVRGGIRTIGRVPGSQ